MLSIIVPAFNEEKNISKTVDNIKKSLRFINKKYEIIIINDCSTDDTLKKILKLRSKNKYIKIFSNKKNLGFGASFKKGLKFSKGSKIMWLQGDNAWSYKMLEKLFKTLDNPKFDLIVQINKKMLSERGFVRWFISKLFTFLLNFFTNKKIFYHNGLQIHKKKFLKKIKIKENHYCFQAEILLKSMKYYRNIKYIDLQSQSRDYGFSKAFGLRNILSTLIFIFNSRSL